MNKLIIWIIGVVVIVVGVVGTIIYINSAKVVDVQSGKTINIKTGSDAIVSVDACDILTSTIAKQILGDAAVKSIAPASQISTKDVSISDCVYTARIDPSGAVSTSNTKGVNVLVRAAKTSAGVESNKSQFGSNKPAGVQDVDVIGDAAFFNPQYGQLNILKGGNWYIVTNYSGTAGVGTMESDKQLADLIELK